MSQPSWIGQLLNGRYQITTVLGQGGMSAVYKANDPNLKRIVAIKMIHSHLSSDKEFIKRFEEEAAAIASLRHPNIVQVYDFNTDSEVHYMVLEFVKGESLYERLGRLASSGNRLPIDEAVRFTLSICSALSYAHHRNIIHRDIKPANIMINEEDQAILMDFGIVKIVGGTSHTATGSVLGTARYISPEVIRAEPADQRSDIYSLGIALFEMLSGQTPFQSDSSIKLMMMHLNDPVPDPRSLRKDIPEQLVKILHKSLEKDPGKRYQNAAEMAADLNSVLHSLGNSTWQAPKANVQAQASIQAPSYSTAPPVPPASHPTRIGTVFGSSTDGHAAEAAPATTHKNNPWLWLVGVVALLIIFFFLLVGIGAFVFSRQIPTIQQTHLPAQPQPAIVDTTKAPPVTTLVVAAPPLDNPTPSSTEALAGGSQTLNPTPTLPNLLVRITSIVRRGGVYEVQYETEGFVEKIPFTHLHFYFNNVAEEQAGKPGRGPWIMYGGPRPFNGYSISQTPEGVTQMCAIVVNPDHSVIIGSGNCLDLPTE